MARSVVNTKDDQQSHPQVPKLEAMEQKIQADPVQSYTTQTINRRSHCHTVNKKDIGGSEEEIQ
eukprot:1634874-Ditylum_brightwellii.AAC.1